MKRWHKFLSGYKVLRKPHLKFACLVPTIILLTIGCQPPKEPFAPVVNGWQQSQADYHRVGSGDTLYAIAWYYGYDVRELAKMNNLTAPYVLKIGQKIVFEQQKTPQAHQRDSVLTTKTKKQTLTKKLSVAANGHQTDLKRGTWKWPTKGKVVNQFYQQNQSNKGIDITGLYRQPIYASLSGKVVYSGNGLVGYGNLIIIKHSDDFLSAYAYNAKNLINEGDSVVRGQKIALMGRPDSRSPRLHFEIRQQGKPINPVLYLEPN